MKLTELDPRFIRRAPQDGREYWPEVPTISESDGIVFLCPKCFAANGGPVGTHSIICWQPKVPPDVDPKPGRWPFTGSGFGDLSLTPSVLLLGGCGWHGFVTNGEVTTC